MSFLPSGQLLAIQDIGIVVGSPYGKPSLQNRSSVFGAFFVNKKLWNNKFYVV